MNGPIVKDDKIKTGDVVILKSGGPRMTVGEVGPGTDADGDALHAGECVCAWFPVTSHGPNGAVTYGAAWRVRVRVDMLDKVRIP